MPLSMLRLVLAAALGGLSVAASGGERPSRSETMPFRDCLALIDEVAGEFGSSGMRIERTADRRSARIEAADGVVTLVCSRIDQTVTLTRSAG